MTTKYKYVYLNHQGQNVLGHDGKSPKVLGLGYKELEPTLDQLTEDGWKHSSSVVVGDYVLVILEKTTP